MFTALMKKSTISDVMRMDAMASVMVLLMRGTARKRRGVMSVFICSNMRAAADGLQPPRVQGDGDFDDAP